MAEPADETAPVALLLTRSEVIRRALLVLAKDLTLSRPIRVRSRNRYDVRFLPLRKEP